MSVVIINGQKSRDNGNQGYGVHPGVPGTLSGGDGGAATTVAVAATDSGQRSADKTWFLIGLALVGLGVLIGWYLQRDAGGPVVALQPGISLFALLFVAAQAIERLAELVSRTPWIGMRFKGDSTIDKGTARRIFNQAIAAGSMAVIRAEKDDAADAAAEAAQDLAIINANRSSFFFGLNAAMAAIAAGYLNLHLLGLIGVSGVASWLDLLVTSLVISGGTKPLHDLISRIESSKQNSQSQNQIQVV
jgi:hypothetical protein